MFPFRQVNFSYMPAMIPEKMGLEHGKDVHMGDLVIWWCDDGIKIAPLLPQVSDVGCLSHFCATRVFFVSQKRRVKRKPHQVMSLESWIWELGTSKS